MDSLPMGKLRLEVTKASLSCMPKYVGPILWSSPGSVGSEHEMLPTAVQQPVTLWVELVTSVWHHLPVRLESEGPVLWSLL